MEKSVNKVPSVKLSDLDSLDSVTKARYLDKLSIIDKIDPYTVEKRKWSQKTEEFLWITGTCGQSNIRYLVRNPAWIETTV
jgi:hypothetical protein